MHLSEVEYDSVFGSVVAEVVAIDEFPMSRHLKTESLDLDHFSDFRKRDA